jgi:hypothetical protein
MMLVVGIVGSRLRFGDQGTYIDLGDHLYRYWTILQIPIHPTGLRSDN